MAYWAATRLESRREKVAQYFLEQAGYEVYLPKVGWHTSRTRSTRVSPLFQGYLFTRIELQWRGAPYPGALFFSGAQNIRRRMWAGPIGTMLPAR